MARVEAVVRRRRRSRTRDELGPLVAGELEIRADQFQAFVGGTQPRADPPRVRARSSCSPRRAGQVIEREEIYQRVWGYAMAHGDRSVDVFVRKLRAKLQRLSPGWDYIHTHFGVGYRFEPESLEAPAPRAGPRRRAGTGGADVPSTSTADADAPGAARAHLEPARSAALHEAVSPSSQLFHTRWRPAGQQGFAPMLTETLPTTKPTKETNEVISKQVAARRRQQRRARLRRRGVRLDDSGDSTSSDGGSASGLSGSITIDGSSTVQPFAEAAAELFNEENPDVKITVGTSGTGGGFEKFCAGETDISDASRPIEPEEVDACKKDGVAYSEVQVANDGIAVVTNPALEISCLTTDQLKQLWTNDSKVTNYSQLGNDADTGQPLPDAELSLYGPGTDSGTFDYFTDAINGEEGVSRKDYQPSEDDNVLVQGVRATGRPRLLRLLLLRAEPGQAEPGRGRRRQRLRRPEHRDDPGRHLHAALAAAVHVPERPRRSQQARGQGVHAVRRRQLRRRSPRRRRSSR